MPLFVKCLYVSQSDGLVSEDLTYENSKLYHTLYIRMQLNEKLSVLLQDCPILHFTNTTSNHSADPAFCWGFDNKKKKAILEFLPAKKEKRASTRLRKTIFITIE